MMNVSKLVSIKLQAEEAKKYWTEPNRIEAVDTLKMLQQ